MRGERKRMNQIYFACRTILPELIVECVGDGLFILDKPDDVVCPEVGMTDQELGKFSLKDFFGIDFSRFGLDKNLLDRLDYSAIMALSIQTYLKMLNNKGEIDLHFQELSPPMKTSDKIAIVSIIVTIIIAVAGFFLNNRDTPVVVNNIVYVQPTNADYTEVFKRIISDMLQETSAPSPRLYNS